MQPLHRSGRTTPVGSPRRPPACDPFASRTTGPSSRDTPIRHRRVSRIRDRRSPLRSLVRHATSSRRAPRAARRVLASAAAVFLLAAPARPLGAQQHPLVSLPLGDPAYVQLDALARLGCPLADISIVRPYIVRDIRDALRRSENDRLCEGPLHDVLRTRFLPLPDSALPGAVPDSGVLYDIEGRPIPVALGVPEEEDLVPRIRLGAAVTVRGTAHGNGEFRPLWREVRPTSEGDPPLVAIARGRLTWDGGDRLAGVVEGYAQTHDRNDPLVRADRFRESTAIVDFSEAYLTGRAGRLVATFGRRRTAWLGDGEESVALSAHGPPIDHFALSLRWPKFEAHAMYGGIDDVVLDTLRDGLPLGMPDQRFYRYIVAHEISWRPSPRFRLTVGETALLSRGARTLDLAYANPLMIYWVTQEDTSYTNRENRDNLGIFLAGRGTFGGATIVGELFIDDFQIDAADRERIPDQLAWSVRASGRLPAALPMLVSAEYRRVDGFTYLKGFYTEAYQQYDEPLGSELGPDADLVRIAAELWLHPLLRAELGGGYWRRGAQRLNDRPSARAQGNVGLGYPTRTPLRPEVQRAVLGDFSLRWLRLSFPVTARVELARIENENNLPFAPALYVRAQVLGTYAFRYP